MRGIKLLLPFFLVTFQNFELTSSAAVDPFSSILQQQQQQQQPIAGSSDISVSFLECSQICRADPGCLGVTVYQQLDTNSNKNDPKNDTTNSGIQQRQQGPPVLNFFWCKLELTDSPDDLAKGQVVYKAMFRDKLEKVERPPPQRPHKKSHLRVRTRRETPLINVDLPLSSAPATIKISSSTPQKHLDQLTTLKKTPNQVALIPPQKTLLVQVPTVPQKQEEVERVTILPGELDPHITIPTTAIPLPPETIDNVEMTTSLPTPSKQEVVVTTPEEVVVAIDKQGRPEIQRNDTSPLKTVVVTTGGKHVAVTKEQLPPSSSTVETAAENDITTTPVPTPVLVDTRINLPPSFSAPESQNLTPTPSQMPSQIGLESSSPLSTTTAAADEKSNIVVDIFPPSSSTPKQKEEEEGEKVVVTNKITFPEPSSSLSSSSSVPSSSELPPSSSALPPSSSELPPTSSKLPTTSSELPPTSDVVVEGPLTLSLIISLKNDTTDNEQQQQYENITEQVTKVKDLMGQSIGSMNKLLQMLSQPLLRPSPQINRISSSSQGPFVTLIEKISQPSPSEQLEGKDIDKTESTDIPLPMIEVETGTITPTPFVRPVVSTTTEHKLDGHGGEHVSNVVTVIEGPKEGVTVAPFPFLRPSVTTTNVNANSEDAAAPLVNIVRVQNGQDVHNTDPTLPEGEEECLFSDRDRFKRNILATTFSMFDGQPTLLTFVNGSECVGTFSKSGKKGIRRIAEIFPQFPSHEKQIVAGVYLQNSVYLFDSDEVDQMVWRFVYDPTQKAYKEDPSERMTKESFLMTKCGVREEDAKNISVRAMAQVSSKDPSCIIFDRSGLVYLSPNSSEDARDLAEAISFMMKTEFVNYVESVFGWLDEPVLNKIYVFGSNSEVYEIYRDESTNFKWQKGAYRVIPYDEFPYR